MIGYDDGRAYESEMHELLDIPAVVDQTSKTSDKPEKDEYNIFFARHGETPENVDNTVRDSNATLTDKGRKQADELGEEMKKKGITALVSSTLPRAVETAYRIKSKTGIRPQFDSRLNTWDVGNIEGESCETGDPKIKDYANNKPNKTIPGGESFNDFKDRSFSGIRAAILNNQNEKLAILTHSRVEDTVNRWNQTGQDNPSLSPAGESAKSEKPGSIEPFTMKANSTIMQRDNFNERFEGQQGKLPITTPNESFEGTPTAYRPWLKEPTPFPGNFESRFNRPSDIQNAPYPEQKDLDLYNPVSEKLPGILGPMMDLAHQADRLSPEKEKRFVEGLQKLIDTHVSDQVSHIQKLREQGLSFDAISERTGLTRGQIAGSLNRAGLSTPRTSSPLNDSEIWKQAKEMKDQGATAKEIAAKFGTSESDVNNSFKQGKSEMTEPSLPKVNLPNEQFSSEEMKSGRSLSEWMRNQFEGAPIESEKLSPELKRALDGSSGNITHPGQRHVIVDKQTGKQVGEAYSNKIRARRRQDRLDNAYGGYRYRVDSRPATKEELINGE